MRKQTIEAVTVCVGYGDFLMETAKHNAALLDRWVIVTSPDDDETREVCRIHDLECILSEDHRRHAGGIGEGNFNKGLMVERGLQHLSLDSWRLHIDGDIVLPPPFRLLLEAAHLDQSKLYGCDRVMIPSWEDWREATSANWLHHTNCSINMPSKFRLGTRYALKSSGYIPIGFFQLWHSDSDEWRGRRVKTYPSLHGDAHRTDVQFALQWDRRQRELLPELIVAHLASEQYPLGINWNGRRTKRFGSWKHHNADGCS